MYINQEADSKTSNVFSSEYLDMRGFFSNRLNKSMTGPKAVNGEETREEVLTGNDIGGGDIGMSGTKRQCLIMRSGWRFI